MITSALTYIPQLILVIVLFNVIRAVFQAAKLAQQHKATENETEEQRRVREIQERIRRKIAERRGQAAPLAPAPEEDQPSLRPSGVPPLEPFGGPSRRPMMESKRWAIPREEPAPFDPAILERQQQLAAQILALDETRIATERRAAQVIEQDANSTASSSTASGSHAGWIGDLRDRHALRRAFVLREVLGPPVALR